MSVSQKKLQELEQKYADVMNNEVITASTQWTPKNSASELPEEELLKRAKRCALEMRGVMEDFDKGYL
jgi:hypothetical protein